MIEVIITSILVGLILGVAIWNGTRERKEDKFVRRDRGPRCWLRGLD